MCVCIVDKLRASRQLIQADLDVEKELQAKLIEALQCSRPTDFLIMQLEDKLLTQQAASSLLDVSYRRGLDIMNGKLKAMVYDKINLLYSTSLPHSAMEPLICQFRCSISECTCNK